jgi:hypothetical protein
LPYRQIAADALAAWRDADRRLAELDQDGDPEARQAAYLEAELAKATYQEAVARAHEEHLPEPLPFDEAVRTVGRE